MSAQEQTEKQTEAKSVNQQLKSKIREMRDNGTINFQDKKDYTEKLKILAKDNNCDYTTVYKSMKEVAKEKGTMVGQPKQPKTTTKSGGMTINFSGKPSAQTQVALAKKKNELAQKQANLEADLKMQEMMIASPVFNMITQRNELDLLMVRSLIEGIGGKVGTVEQYKMLAQQLSLKEVQSGWQPSGMFANILLCASIVGVVALPLVPQIKGFLFSKEKDETEKSDQPLDEIPSDPLEKKS